MVTDVPQVVLSEFATDCPVHTRIMRKSFFLCIILNMIELDALDRTILDEMQLDGRVSATELGRRVGLSPSACLRRVRRLEDAGVIDSYVALVDPAHVARATSVFVEISLHSQREDLLDEFEAQIKTCPEVMSCHLMAGNADYLVHVMCEDVADYERIHRSHLALLPAVSNLRSSFAIRRVLDTTAHTLSTAARPT